MAIIGTSKYSTKPIRRHKIRCKQQQSCSIIISAEDIDVKLSFIPEYGIPYLDVSLFFQEFKVVEDQVSDTSCTKVSTILNKRKSLIN